MHYPPPPPGIIISEPQYICDVCGKKKPVSQMAGKCVTCGKYVCSTCARQKGDKVYCPEHVPKEGCFIATATYGTAMAAQIEILRAFRDSKLESNSVGRRITKLYYTISPPIANIIAKNEKMKTCVRYFLNPVINHLSKRRRKHILNSLK